MRPIWSAGRKILSVPAKSSCKYSRTSSPNVRCVMPDVASDAVVDMHHVIARLQLPDQVAGHHPLGRDQPPDARRAEQLAIGDEDQQTARLVDEARRERAVHEPDVTPLGHPMQLGRRRQGTPGLLEQLADATRLVGGHDDGAAGGRQVDEPSSGALGTARGRRRRRIPRLGVRLLLETLAGAPDDGLQGSLRVVGQRPARWQLARGHQAVPAVDGLRCRVCSARARSSASIGEHEVCTLRHVIGRGTGGEQRRPRLGGLRQVALGEVRGVLARGAR